MAFRDNVKKSLVVTSPQQGESSFESSVEPTSSVVPPSAEVSETELPSDGTYRRCRIEHGARGWGGPLTIAPHVGTRAFLS